MSITGYLFTHLISPSIDLWQMIAIVAACFMVTILALNLYGRKIMSKEEKKLEAQCKHYYPKAENSPIPALINTKSTPKKPDQIHELINHIRLWLNIKRSSVKK